MNAKGPYLQRIGRRPGLWFARTVAMNASDQAVAGKPRGAEALLNRGNMLRQQRRYDEALASYEQAIALEPDYAEALVSRGNALRELRRFEEALASYDRAITLEP